MAQDLGSSSLVGENQLQLKWMLSFHLLSIGPIGSAITERSAGRLGNTGAA